jgi:Xaa-Pro dipeptidase
LVTNFGDLLDRADRIDEFSLPPAARRPHLLDFEITEYARRYARAARLMADEGIDVLVLAQPTSIRYFTGLQTWLWTLPPLIPVVAILPRDPAAATLVDTVLERGGVEHTTWIPEPVLYEASDDPIVVIQDALRDRGLEDATIGLELGLGQRPNLTPSDLERLRAGLPKAAFVDAAMLLWAVRAVKGVPEIEKLRISTHRTEIGFQAALDALKPGISEAELTRIAGRAILADGHRLGVEPMTLIFVAGPDRYRDIVQPATERGIRPGEQVFLDGGCITDGYRADFIRSGVIGRLDEAGEHWYDVAVAAISAAIDAMGPGRKLGDAWTAAQGVFESAGVGHATLMPDMIGHGIGLDHWEPPLVARPGTEFGEVIARPGMTFCVEPTIVGPDGDDTWRSGLFVVEDQLVITETGVEVLTSAIPRTLHRA